MALPERSVAFDRAGQASNRVNGALNVDGSLLRAAVGVGLLLPLLAGGNYFITFDPVTAMSSFSLAVVGFVAASWSSDREQASPGPRGAAPLTLFVCWCLTLLVTRPIGPRAAIDAQGIFCGAVLYGCLSRLPKRPEMIRPMAWGLAAGTTLTAFYAYYQHWVVIPRLMEWMPAHGLDAPYFAANANFYSANCYAPFVASVILIGSGLFWTTAGRARFATLPMIVVCLAALVFARSRSAVALLLISLLGLSLAGRASRHSRWQLIGWVAGTVAALGFLAVLTTNVRELLWVSAGGRLLIWRASLAMAFDHWLIGVGIGRFGEFFPQYELTDYFTRYPHNLLLELFAETGVIGVGSFVAFIASSLQSFRSDSDVESVESRANGSPDLTTFCRAGFGLLLAHSMVDIDWRSPANTILLFVLAALSRR